MQQHRGTSERDFQRFEDISDFVDSVELFSKSIFIFFFQQEDDERHYSREDLDEASIKVDEFDEYLNLSMRLEFRSLHDREDTFRIHDDVISRENIF